ncbi:hypothetical protein [Butyricicoccus sp.]|uniref:hypothetical protein n=1 Tax=Butyricicoccus sp. TaxID=2049021 RepID=UPI003F138CA9
MSKYALMQAPAKDENDFAPRIVIIDNSCPIGKRRVESLVNEGYKPVGWIESPLKLSRLKRGFEANMRHRYENACEKLSKIRLVLNEEDNP